MACVSAVGFPQLAFSLHALTDTRTKTQISVESSVSFFDRQVTTSSARGRLLQLVCSCLMRGCGVRRGVRDMVEMVQVKSQWRHANRNTSLRRRDGLLHHGPWCWGSWVDMAATQTNCWVHDLLAYFRGILLAWANSLMFASCTCWHRVCWFAGEWSGDTTWVIMTSVRACEGKWVESAKECSEGQGVV